MLPETVASKWEQFAPLVQLSLPPTLSRPRLMMANVLRAILMDDLVVWVFLDEARTERYVVTTFVRVDPISLTRDLVVYSFTSINGDVKPSELKAGLEKLKIYGTSQDCDAVVAYSDDKRIVEYVGSLGAKVDFTLILF